MYIQQISENYFTCIKLINKGKYSNTSEIIRIQDQPEAMYNSLGYSSLVTQLKDL